jgi:hypothetical protein
VSGPGGLTAGLALLCVLLLPAPAARGLDISLGWGYGVDFSQEAFQGVYSGTSSDVTSPAALSVGGYVDAAYGRLGVACLMDTGTTQPSPSTPIAQYFSAYLMRLVFSAAAKYPFAIGPVKAFPMVGVEYRLPIVYHDDKSQDLLAALAAADRAALQELWVQGGAGADISLGEPFFCRLEVRVGYKVLGAASGQGLPSTHPLGSTVLTTGSLSVDAGLTFGARLF